MQHGVLWHISLFGVGFFSERDCVIEQLHLLNIVHLCENLLAELLLAHFCLPYPEVFRMKNLR